MKVAHVMYGFKIGGIETMLINISRFQSRAGAQVHIIVINDLIDESLVSQLDPRVRLHLIRRKVGSHNPLDVLKLNFVLLKINPDIIHLHNPSISKLIFIPGAKRKTCCTLHDMCNPDNTQGITDIPRIFTISEIVRQDLLKKYGVSATTILNGIDTSKIRRKTDYPSSSKMRIVHVGRMEAYKKAQDILIRAVARLIKAGREIHLTLIGGGKDLEAFQELAKNEGVENYVDFLNDQPQEYVLSHLADYDIYVHPSLMEGFGLTVAEAMAAGVPVVVADNDGPMEIIEHGKYGSFFSVGNVEACADAIGKLIDNYPTVDFIDRAAEHIKKNFEVSVTAHRYLEAYKKIIEQRKHGR